MQRSCVILLVVGLLCQLSVRQVVASESSKSGQAKQVKKSRVKRSKGRRVKRSKGRRVKRSKGRRVKRSRGRRVRRFRVVNRPSWRRMWRRQRALRRRKERARRARQRRAMRLRRQRDQRLVGQGKRVARLFVTTHTPQTRAMHQRLLAQATQLQVKLPEKLPPRQDASYPQTRLSSIYKLVKTSNIDLRILRQQVVQAELMRAKSWSILKPQLQLQASYVRSDNETAILGNVITPQNLLSVQLQLQWAFLNLSAIPLLQTAYLSVKQVGHTAKQVKREVLYATARAYYGVLLADGLVTIAEQSWTNAKEHLRISMARFQAKVTPELAVTRAQLDVAKAWQSYIQAQNGLGNARLGLAILLNRPSYEIRPVRPSSPALPSGDLMSWRKMSLQRRHEIKAAKIAVAMAEKGVTQKWMAYLPTVAAVSAVQGSNAGGLANRNFQWSISLVAQLKLYNGGVRHLEVREAHSKLLQARLQLAKTVRQADNEVSQAALTLQTAKVTLQVAKKQRMLAERSHQLTEDRYKAGVATPVEVSDALTALQSARIATLREELNYEIALLALRRALGLFQP